MFSFRSACLLLTLSFFSIAACAPPDEVPDHGNASGLSNVASVSGPSDEGWYSESPGGTMIVFGQTAGGRSILMVMEKAEEGWSKAAPLPFSGTFNDRAARFYPALHVLLFSSDRPLPGETEAGDYNLWMVAFDGEEWMMPEPFMVATTDADEYHGAVSGNGTIYFASNREGGQGSSDIYRARLGSMGYEVEAVDGPINTVHAESDVWIDPGERYLIFSRRDDVDGLGGDDLWISFAGGEGWSAPVNLGEGVNAAGDEYGAWVSRDGATLYVTTHRSGQADIARIALADLPIEGPAGWMTGAIDE